MITIMITIIQFKHLVVIDIRCNWSVFDICQNVRATVLRMKQPRQQHTVNTKSSLEMWKSTFNEWSAIVKHRIVKPELSMNHNRNTVIKMRAMRVFASLIFFSSFQTDLFIAKKNGVHSNAQRKKWEENICVSRSQHLEMGTIFFFGISFSQLKVFRNVEIYFH